MKWRGMLEGNGELTEANTTLLRQMERYAASVGCRHQHLAEYFGDAYTKDGCGACDYCLGELEEMPDSVTLARKILSCVARVQQRFGILHVVNVLRGAETEAVISRGHSLLSVFGLLRDASIDEVRGYIEQLIAEGFLIQTEGEYPILMMTAEGVELLKDATAAPGLVLARQRKVEKGKLPKRSKTETESWSGVDKDLFEQLRALRLRVARERGVPPYVIFHDTTLRELARLKPADIDAMRHIYGFGEKKVNDLGDAVLDVIRAHA